jgi:hypothetical protein
MADRLGIGREVGQHPPAPGSAQVQAVEMRDLAVAPVAHHGGRKQGGGQLLADAGQERGELGAELAVGQGCTHTLGLDQRGRQEFVAAWFPGLAVSITRVPAPRSLLQ